MYRERDCDESTLAPFNHDVITKMDASADPKDPGKRIDFNKKEVGYGVLLCARWDVSGLVRGYTELRGAVAHARN